MSRESQYVDQYLDGPAYTVGTFLTYTLRGKAKLYSRGYHNALLRSLQQRVIEGAVTIESSVRGRVAFRRAQS